MHYTWRIEISLIKIFAYFKNFLYICTDMTKDRIIIALSGDKSAGKDTIATMLEYIMNVGLASASYNQWYSSYIVNEKDTEVIIHFADKLKEICASITNLPVYYFNKSRYKDELWWVYGTEYFVPEETIENHEPYTSQGKQPIKYVKIENLLVTTLAEELSHIKESYTRPVIKLRTILQFVGTEMFKNMFDSNYWISNTLKRASKILSEKNYCIISDLRFKDEAFRTRDYCQSLGYKFIIINIGIEEQFTKHENERQYHQSDRRLNDFDIYVQNKKDGLFKLFNKILEVYQKLIIE